MTANDPASAMLAAFGDLCRQGFGAWQALAAMAADAGNWPQPAQEAARPLADLAAAMAGMAQAQHGEAGGPAAGGAASGQADLVQAMAQAWLVAAASAFRYGQALLEVQGRYQGSVLRAMADRAVSEAEPPEAGRVLVDDLRGFLREVGEAADREARRLRSDLDRIGEQIARAADRASPSSSLPAEPGVRPHRAKE